MTPWRPWQRVAFRVAFIYLATYTLDLFISYWVPIPQLTWKGRWYEYVVQKPSHWASGHLFHACGVARSAYYCWTFENLWLLLLALAGAALWTVLDRRRPDYRRLHAWLRTSMRYFLAFVMWMYAYDKFIGVQFGRGPEGDALHAALGDTSPMQLMWGTMGYSFIYGTFTGIGEITGGLLLLFRRTTTLGALVVVVIMANVTVLDVVHRVSVSEKAFNYMLMAAFLVIPDMPRLFDFYVRNRGIPAAPVEPPVVHIHPAVRGLLLAFATLLPVQSLWPSKSWIWFVPPKHPLQGVYVVDRFVRNGDTLPPRLGDSTRWERVGLGLQGVSGAATSRLDPKGNAPSMLQARTMTGNWTSFGIMVDTAHHWMLLTESRSARLAAASRRDSTRAKSPTRAASVPPDTMRPPKFAGELAFAWEARDRLHIAGKVHGVPIDATLRRVDDTAWPMRARP